MKSIYENMNAVRNNCTEIVMNNLVNDNSKTGMISQEIMYKTYYNVDHEIKNQIFYWHNIYYQVMNAIKPFES